MTHHDDDWWHSQRQGPREARHVIGFEVGLLLVSMFGMVQHFRAAGETTGPVHCFQKAHVSFQLSQVLLSALILAVQDESHCLQEYVTMSFERLALVLFILMWGMFATYWDSVFCGPGLARPLHAVRRVVFVATAVAEAVLEVLALSYGCGHKGGIHTVTFIVDRSLFILMSVDAAKIAVKCLARDCGLHDDQRHSRFLKSFRSGRRLTAAAHLSLKEQEHELREKPTAPWWQRRYVRHAISNIIIAWTTGYRGVIELSFFIASNGDSSNGWLKRQIDANRFEGSLSLPFLVPSLVCLCLMWKRTYLSPIELRPTDATGGILHSPIMNMLITPTWEPDSSEAEFRVSIDEAELPTQQPSCTIEDMTGALQRFPQTLKANHLVLGLKVSEHCHPSSLAFALAGLFIRDVGLPLHEVEFLARKRRASNLLEVSMPRLRDGKSMSQLQEQAQYEELVKLVDEMQAEEREWLDSLRSQVQILGPMGKAHSLDGVDPLAYFKPSREKDCPFLSLLATNLMHHYTTICVHKLRGSQEPAVANPMVAEGKNKPSEEVMKSGTPETKVHESASTPSGSEVLLPPASPSTSPLNLQPPTVDGNNRLASSDNLDSDIGSEGSISSTGVQLTSRIDQAQPPPDSPTLEAQQSQGSKSRRRHLSLRNSLVGRSARVPIALQDNPAARSPDLANAVAEVAAVTYGAPSAHALGFSDGSIGQIERELNKVERKAAEVSLSPKAHAQRLRLWFKRRQREVVCVSQALSAAVAACCEVLVSAINRKDQVLLGQIASVGMLLHECSLLSTRGKELSMLDDMREALSRLELTIVLERDHAEPGSHEDQWGGEHEESLENPLHGLQEMDLEAPDPAAVLRPQHSRPLLRADVSPSDLKLDDIRVSRIRSPALDLAREMGDMPTKSVCCGNVLVTLLLPDEHFDAVCKLYPTDTEVNRYLASERRAKDVATLMPIVAFRVLPCLFTQGVNEQQSLSNHIGSAGVQDKINNEGLSRLIDYHTEYVRYHLDRLLSGVNEAQAEDTTAGQVEMMVAANEAGSVDLGTRSSGSSPSLRDEADPNLRSSISADRSWSFSASRPASFVAVRGLSSLTTLTDFRNASWASRGTRLARHSQRLKAALWRVASTVDSKSVYCETDHIEAWAEDLLALDLMVVHLRELVSRQHENGGKNVDLLVTSAVCARMMRAARTTSCKSAKDRTSVFHTLEVARLMASLGFLSSSSQVDLQGLLDIMRGPSGVRIRNCKLNTGKAMYAFNDLQLKTFPTELVPPPGTYSSGGQT